MLLLALAQWDSFKQDNIVGLEKCNAAFEERGLLDIPFISGYCLQKFFQTFSMAYSF